MPTRALATLVLLVVTAVPGAAFDLKQIQSEPNLEKRSRLAVDNALVALQSARDAYRGGDAAKMTALIAEVTDSVDLAYKSLQQTGKDPRRSPKWFKYAEMNTRELLRRIAAFQDEMSFSERPALDKLKEKTQQVHDDLLLGLMEGKKK